MYRADKDEFGVPLSSSLLSRLCLRGTLVQKLVSQERILVNHHRAPLEQPLRAGDRVQVLLFEEEDYGVVPEVMDIDVCYEDDHLLIVNKAAGIAVHPTDAGETGTLANGIAFYYQAQGVQQRVRLVHRLDKDTSGAIVIAKHAIAHALLDEALRERRMKRKYVAFTTGVFQRPRGSIDAPIGRDRHHATRRRVSPTGDRAVSHYAVVEQYSDATYVELELETGRTHQLRVHLSHIGHPIYGDTLYGGPRYPIRRQALHATHVQFEHPLYRTPIEVDVAMPDDMTQLRDYLRSQ